MRDDQLVRLVAAVVVGIGYCVRTAVVGNGAVPVFGYQAAPFAIFAATELTLALPETLDMLPVGPTRSGGNA